MQPKAAASGGLGVALSARFCAPGDERLSTAEVIGRVQAGRGSRPFWTARRQASDERLTTPLGRERGGLLL
jgi:hypothetical protein